jgi:DNA-directed RNA polymerase specialized sigma24 family protein
VESDGELIRMSTRRPEAFVGIFERHFDSIYGYLARRVGRLLAWAELTYEEIAAAVDAPIGTVRSRLNRARMHVREALVELEALDG